MNLRVLRLWWGEIRRRKSWLKNRKHQFNFFLATIFITQFPPSQSQDSWIRDIVSLSNIFEILPITIAGPSNSRYRVFISFENFKFWKLLIGELGDEDHGWKNWKRRFDFFLVAIFVTQPPTHSPLSHCNHHRTLEFAILNLHEMFLGIYSSQYQIWGSHDYDGGGGGNENRGQKIENVGRALKKMFNVDKTSRPA